MGGKRKFKSEEEKSLYHTWKHFRQACNNANAQDYERVGGLGVSYSKEWDLFENFYGWAMQNGYALGMVLQRKDSKGDFTPENCYFVNSEFRNTKIRANSFVVEYLGQKMTNETFARTVNINPHKTLRLLKEGKTAEEIVRNRDPEHDKYICYGHDKNSVFLTEETKANQPGSRSRVSYEINGVVAPLAELCEKFGNGITRKEAQRRISRGWSAEAAVLTPVTRRKDEAEPDQKD